MTSSSEGRPGLTCLEAALDALRLAGTSPVAEQLSPGRNCDLAATFAMKENRVRARVPHFALFKNSVYDPRGFRRVPSAERPADAMARVLVGRHRIIATGLWRVASCA